MRPLGKFDPSMFGSGADLSGKTVIHVGVRPVPQHGMVRGAAGVAAICYAKANQLDELKGITLAWEPGSQYVLAVTQAAVHRGELVRQQETSYYELPTIDFMTVMLPLLDIDQRQILAKKGLFA